MNLFTCTHDNEYTHLLEYLRVITEVRPLGGLPKDKFYLSFGGGFAGCANRKALRLKATGVYSCK